MPTLPTLLVNGDGTGPRGWLLQTYLNVNEGISAADGASIRAALPNSDNRNTSLDTSFTLDNTPAAFGSMDTLSWQVRYRADNSSGDDTLTLSIRIVNGGTILAAGSSGGAFQTVNSGANSTWPTSLTNSSATAFTYVNTTATKTQWDGAQVEIRSTQSTNMGPDDNTVLVDTLEFTGTYSEAGPAASATQAGFRIRSDDSEALNASTGWAAAVNTNASIEPDRRFRLRFLIQSTTTAFTDGFTLERRINGGAWADVVADEHHFGPGNTQNSVVAAVPSDQYTDLAATTQVIGLGAFVAGDGCETATSGTITFTGSNETELEWCLVLRKIADSDTGLDDGDTVEFRVTYDDGTVLETYSQTPTITVANRAGWLGFVPPETGSYFGPFVDANNNMYIMGERSDTGGSNLPTIMKSTDDGVSWTEATRTSAPTETDCEGISVVQNGDTLTIFHRRGADECFAHEFRTSDHTSPDTWGTVDDPIMTTAQLHGKFGSVESISAGYRPSTSDFVLGVHGLDAAAGSGAVWIVSGVVGSWDTPVLLDTSHGADDLSGPQLVVGENSIAHVFYPNATDGVLYHKTIAADATVTASSLSPAQGTAGNTIATDMQTGSADSVAVTAPVYWLDAGVEKILVGWYNTSANLQVNVLHDGTLQTVRTANDAAIADDTADHEGAYFAALAVDPDNDNIYAFWTDDSDNSLLMRADATDPLSTFGTPVTFQNSATLAGVDENRSGESSGGGWDVKSARVITHGGGKVVAVVGSWSQGGTGAQYFEIALSSPSTGVSFHDGTSVVAASTVEFHDGAGVATATSTSFE